MRIDYDLLVTQRDFLLEYPWRDNTDLPEEVDGLINLLDALIDEGVDAMERTPAISSQASTSGRCATCSVGRVSGTTCDRSSATITGSSCARTATNNCRCPSGTSSIACTGCY